MNNKKNNSSTIRNKNIKDITDFDAVRNELNNIKLFLHKNKINYTISPCKLEYRFKDELRCNMCIITDFNRESYRFDDIVKRIDTNVEKMYKVIIVVHKTDIKNIEQIYKGVEKSTILYCKPVIYFSRSSLYLNIIKHYRIHLKGSNYIIQYYRNEYI